MKSLEISMQLLRARDAARGLFREEYHAKLAPFKADVQRVMRAQQLDALRAVLWLSEHEGVGMLTLAAAVELIEEQETKQ